MENTPKRQHLVQKRLLSMFTSTPQYSYDKQLIWQFDKRIHQSKEISLKVAGMRRRFLNSKADKIITNLEMECFPLLN